MSTITITIPGTATITVDATTIEVGNGTTIVIEDGEVSPPENYYEITSIASQSVFTFGVAITPSSTNTQHHQLFRNGQLQTESLNYTVTNAATGEVTFSIGLAFDELVALYLI